jgi:hypothetical protein
MPGNELGEALGFFVHMNGIYRPHDDEI